MKLQCARKDLVEAVGFVAPVAGVRSPQPLLQTLRLEAADGKLTLLACDSEMWAERVILAAIEEPGTVCVQSKVLYDLLAALPDGPVNIEVSGGNMVIQAGASDWRLMCFPADDFPLIPQFNSMAELKMSFAEFGDAVDSVVYAVADDSARMVLTGVLFTYDGERMTLVATDTHRLAVLKMPKAGMGSNVNAVVPGKAIRSIKALPLNSGDEITIQFDTMRLMVDAGDARIVSQLLSGSYPNWEKVVPEQHTRTWTLDRAELADNLKRTMILAKDSANRVRFGGQAETVLISAKSEEKGESKEEIAAVMDNGDIEIAFNGKYVLDAIAALKADAVVAQMTESSRPALFKPSEGDDRFCVIMPMALN